MAKPTKYGKKVQELIFKFIIVPLIFVIGLNIVSKFIAEETGIPVFRWFLFGAGIIGALAYYYKKHLAKIDW